MRQIQDYIGFQLLQAHKAHRSRAEAALNKLGVHTGQEMILLHLWIEEGIPQAQLAACMGVEPPTATTEIYTLSLHDALPILLCPFWQFTRIMDC